VQEKERGREGGGRDENGTDIVRSYSRPYSFRGV